MVLAFASDLMRVLIMSIAPSSAIFWRALGRVERFCMTSAAKEERNPTSSMVREVRQSMMTLLTPSAVLLMRTAEMFIRPLQAIILVMALLSLSVARDFSGLMISMETRRSSMSSSMVKKARDFALYCLILWSEFSDSVAIERTMSNSESNSLESARPSPARLRMQDMQYVRVSRSDVERARSRREARPPSSANCFSICSLRDMLRRAAAHFLLTLILGSSTGSTVAKNSSFFSSSFSSTRCSVDAWCLWPWWSGLRRLGSMGRIVPSVRDITKRPWGETTLR
mmetsp:Transcript_21985/g.45792  ORF Transcript_21985/g.45792 Transcript_21985/m.45792 type:complete len:283 (+) Transcript_21985:2830-3678(+)